MDNPSFLLLRVQELHYAIAATQVLEIIKLPELMPVANMPDDIIGLLNYRGLALPVMHLSRRLGQAQEQCSIKDTLVVLEWEAFKVGLVVQTVEDIRVIESNAIATGFSLGRDADINAAFLSGIATVDDEMVMILNPEALIRQPDERASDALASEATLSAALSEGQLSEGQLSEDQVFDGDGSLLEAAGERLDAVTGKSFFDRYCAGATPEERSLFRQRAEALRPVRKGMEHQQLSAVAVMRLGEDYFGLDLAAVREFIQVANVTPVPCCPSHILGNMNLRGEVMTLVDIRSALSLDNAAAPKPEKAIVVDVDDIVAGITVDQVCDIVQFSNDDISAVPAAANLSGENYFTGIASYQKKQVGIIDFSRLIQAESLVVNEAV